MAGVIDLRKSNKGNIPGRGGPNKKRRGEKIDNRQPKAPMLNMRRLGDFRYDIREVVARSQMDEASGPSFIAQVIAKASRISIRDAKKYVRDFEQREELSRNASEDICRLLDRYTKYR
jgi:hypothetical protein